MFVQRRFVASRLVVLAPCLLVLGLSQLLPASVSGEDSRPNILFRPLPCSLEEGLLAERVDVWRQKRLWHMLDAEDDYLLSGFESRPGRHPWQGEHVGKWLHAATLAYDRTRDEKLLKALQETVDRLLAAQLPNGYLGTYGDDYTFMALPTNESVHQIVDDVAPQRNQGTQGGRAANQIRATARMPLEKAVKKTSISGPAIQRKRRAKPRGGWDTWTLRYNLYGLLTYEQFHPDDRVVDACRKMADLLIEVYGEGKSDLTKYGTRQGISATTLLESIVMLYDRTQDQKYLDFAEHIVAMSESNPKLRLMGAMLDRESVVYSGDGKAYQLMANLLGYLGLYRNTGNERYLKMVQNAWHDIKTRHVDVTGGPWGRHMTYNGNRECFALLSDYDPAAVDVETCSTTTWVQLNLHLLEVTGQARYAVEAERAVFNAIMAAQHEDGLDWCYYIRANQNRRPYELAIKCCSSSGPRALEMFARYLVGEVEGGISFVSLVPCSVVLPESPGRAKIKVMGNYPLNSDITIHFEESSGKEFALEFRDPADSQLKAARINGQEIALNKNHRGFYRVLRGWKAGDEITLEFEYLLRTHIVTPQDDPAWVAFTYGPWALAQQTNDGVAVAEPFIGEEVRSTLVSQWLELQSPGNDAAPKFRIRNTEIQLRPFYSAGSREAGPRTYFRLVEADERPRRRQSAPAIDIFRAVAEFAPGWGVSNCGNAMNPGQSAAFRGKSNVLVTHPLDRDTPCTLARTVDIPPGKRTVLTVVVSHHPRGDWNLKLKANGQQKDETKPISTKTCPDGWRRVEFDLSEWSGQTVKLELLNEASGWNFEAGYWSEIKIDSEADGRNALN